MTHGFDVWIMITLSHSNEKSVTYKKKARMIKVLLVEDHPIVRNGIKATLEQHADMVVVGEVGTAGEALALLKSGTSADVVLVDISLQQMDGISLTQQLSEKYPTAAVVILTITYTNKLVHSAFNAGAKGYILKSAPVAELLFAIRHVASGHQTLSSELALNVLKQLTANFTLNAVAVSLAPREKQVLELISQGYSNQQIADQIFVSRRTVESHRQSLIEKTGVKNSAQLVHFACKNDLL